MQIHIKVKWKFTYACIHAKLNRIQCAKYWHGSFLSRTVHKLDSTLLEQAINPTHSLLVPIQLFCSKPKSEPRLKSINLTLLVRRHQFLITHTVVGYCCQIYISEIKTSYNLVKINYCLPIGWSFKMTRQQFKWTISNQHPTSEQFLFNSIIYFCQQ